jgi:hypothetical protein
MSKGFLALGYERSLYVIDLRGPRIILQHPCTKRKSGSLDGFTVLNWSICGLNGELLAYSNRPQFPYITPVESTSPSLHLFAGTTSGAIQVLSLVHSQGGWSVDPNILTLSPIDNLTNLTTLIAVDAMTGEELTPSPERLLTAMKGSKGNNLYWIIATTTEVRCMDGISTKRIGSARFPVGVGVGAKEIGVVRHAGTLVDWTGLSIRGRTKLTFRLPRFGRAHGVYLRRGGDRIFDPESATITTLPEGERK